MVSGQEIKAKRIELKLSAPQLGARLGIDPENIYKWEKGTKPSDPDDYKKIEKFVLEGLEYLESMEDVPNKVAEDLAPYGNLAHCLGIIESQQRTIENQAETIRMLVNGTQGGEPVRKRAS